MEVVEKKEEKLRKKQRELLQKANARFFERECKAYGMSAESLVSPSLLKALGYALPRKETESV